MNPHLNYLVANERMADLMCSADYARLASSARTVEANAGRVGLSTRLFVGLRV